MRGYTLIIIIVNVKIVNLDEGIHTYKIVNKINIDEGIYTYKFINSVSKYKQQNLKDYTRITSTSKHPFLFPLGSSMNRYTGTVIAGWVVCTITVKLAWLALYTLIGHVAPSLHMLSSCDRGKFIRMPIFS